MAERIPQSATIRVPLQAYLSSDHVTPATGKTIAITISKNGAAYGNPSGGATNAVEIASGSYYVDLSTTDTGTTGPLFVLGAVATIDNVVAIYNVVKATNGGWTALPDTAATTNASLLTSGSGTDQLSVSSGKVILQATQTGVTIPTVTTVTAVTGLTASNLDATISSRMATYTQPTGFLAATFPTGTVANTTNITAGTITTTTNLTNAPTAGDFTATMKTSIGTAVAASAVASVTGNVGGNVTGSVGSVVGAVGSVTGAVGSVTGAVGSVTGNVGGNVTGSVASVLTGGLIDLTSTTYAESTAVVASTATLKDSLVWLKTLSRNKITQTATTETLLRDDGSTTVSTSTDSDDGTTFTRGKWA